MFSEGSFCLRLHNVILVGLSMPDTTAQKQTLCGDRAFLFVLGWTWTRVTEVGVTGLLAGGGVCIQFNDPTVYGAPG